MKNIFNREWLENYKTIPKTDNTVYKNYQNPGMTNWDRQFGSLSPAQKERYQGFLNTIPDELKGLSAAEMQKYLQDVDEKQNALTQERAGYENQIQNIRSQEKQQAFERAKQAYQRAKQNAERLANTGRLAHERAIQTTNTISQSVRPKSNFQIKAEQLERDIKQWRGLIAYINTGGKTGIRSNPPHSTSDLGGLQRALERDLSTLQNLKQFL